MSELGDKVKASLERIKAFEPKNGEGYCLAFSGGKDSVVCKALLDMAGVKYDAFYRVTSVDPPALVKFIREKHPDVKREVPRYSESYKNPKLAGKPITMWNLISEKRFPPTRFARYCCAELKESGGDGRMTVTGVRWAESTNRKKNQGMVTMMGKKAGKELEADENFRNTQRGGVVLVNDNEESRRMVESCYKRHKTTLNPIIDWSNAEVWEFIRSEGVPYCELYDEGWSRIGCIGCPMATQHEREKHFVLWPKYKAAYLRAFDKMLDWHRQRGDMRKWNNETTAQDIFNGWMEYDILPGQMDLFEMEETDEEEDM